MGWVHIMQPDTLLGLTEVINNNNCEDRPALSKSINSTRAKEQGGQGVMMVGEQRI